MLGKIIYGSLLKMDTQIKTMESLLVPLSVLSVPQFIGINILFAIDNSGPVYVQSLSCLVQTSSEYEQQGVLSPNCSNTCLMHLLVISNFWLLKIALFHILLPSKLIVFTINNQYLCIKIQTSEILTIKTNNYQISIIIMIYYFDSYWDMNDSGN